MLIAVLILTCLVSAAGWCLITRTQFAAWTLVTTSAVWLPANNGHLEGHIVFTLNHAHGITQGDFVGITGWLFGTGVLSYHALRSDTRSPRSPHVGVVLLICLAILAVGMLSAYASG
jgi:hypothetical protein